MPRAPETPCPRDWQRELYLKHAAWVAGSPPSMAVGDGWADLVSRLFDRIAAAVATEPPGIKFVVIDIKEKFGQIRIDLLAPVGPEAEAAIDAAVLLAELRSECTCDECGSPGALRSTLGMSGWLAVKCDEHAAGYPRQVSRGRARRRTGGKQGPVEVVYDRDRDVVLTRPVAE